MRTTIRLDKQLLTAAKQFATRTGRTLGVIEDALGQALADAKRSRKGTSVRLPTFRGNEPLPPGVNLNDTAALLSLTIKPRGHSKRPDFLARLKDVYGDKPLKVSGAKLVSRERKRS